MKSTYHILCAALLLLLCLSLSCCGKKPVDLSDDPVDSSAQTSDPTEESTPCDAPDPLAALLRCVKVTEDASSFSAALEGTCSTQVLLLSYTQQVRSERTVTADAMFSQNVSISSLVRVGVQQYFQGDAILVRNGEVRAIDQVNWSEEAVSVTPEAYSAAYGNAPRSLSNYLINEETVLSAELESATEDEITVICELDPVKSTVAYAKQVKTNGGLDTLPVFSSVTLTVTMDGAYRPIRVRYREVYDISIAILGKTTCKTDYVETFSDFDAVTSVPEQAFFEPFLSLPTTEFPEISGGYSLLFSLLGNSTSYALTLETAGQTLPLQLSLDAASGSVLLHGEAVDLLYEKDRYYLLSAENRVFVNAEDLNRLLLPLTEQPFLPGVQEQGGIASLFSDMRTQTKDGTLLLQAGDERDFFHASIDLRTLSLLSAEISLTGSDTPFLLQIEKTDGLSSFPMLTDCTDLTPSLSAFSSLELLPALRRGETLSARLRVEGDSAYTADLALSMQDDLRFSILPTSDTLPLSVYGKREEITVVWEEISLSGTYEDFTALLASLSGTQPSNALSWTAFSLPRLTAGSDNLTLAFKNGLSLTFAGSEIRLSGSGLSVRISIRGTSVQKVSSAPKTVSRLAAADLNAFLSDSVYPAFLRSDAMTGELLLSQGGEEIRFRLRARLMNSLALGLTTNWNGAEADLLYTDGTLFLSHPAFNTFLPFDRLSAISSSLQLLSDSLIDLSSGREQLPVVSCDGKQLTFIFDDTLLRLEKDRFTVSSAGWEAIGTAFIPSEEPLSFTPPDRSDCIDLAALAERIASLAAQQTFAFTGKYKDDRFSADLSRLSLTRKENGELDDIAVDFLPDGLSDPIRLFYNDGCLFLDIGATRLFCPADALFLDANTIGTPVLNDALLSGVKKLTFRDDILELQTADTLLRIMWKGDALSGVIYSSGGRTLSLQSASFAPAQTPPLEQYTDITPFAGLLRPLIATLESGSVAFDGKIDLRAFSLSLTDIRISGAFCFSGERAEGALTIVLPYLPGLASDGVPPLHDDRLLTGCTMCSELFLTDGKLYMRRTVDATYGILHPQSYTSTESVYLTSEEVLADPMRALAFLLRLQPDLFTRDSIGNPSRSAGNGNLFKRASRDGNRFTLELNPEAVLPAADSILLHAQTDGEYVTGIGMELNFPHLSIVASWTLLAHGDVDLFPVLQQDFSGYVHLHN